MSSDDKTPVSAPANTESPPHPTVSSDGAHPPPHNAEHGNTPAALDLDEEALAQIEGDSAPIDQPTPSLKELLQSSDQPSRYLTALSIVFAILAAVCFSLLVSMYLKHRHHAKKLAPEPEPKIVITTEPLGEFRVFLKSEKPGVEELELRADLVAECSSKEACESLQVQLPIARDLILPVLSSVTQEEILQASAKNQIKKRVTDRLNTMKLDGKILQVDITDLSVERGK